MIQNHIGMCFFLAGILCGAIKVGVASESDAAKQRKELNEIRGWCKDLQSEDYSTRLDAEGFLLASGQQALIEVKKCLNSDSFETKTRASRIVAQIEWNGLCKKMAQLRLSHSSVKIEMSLSRFVLGKGTSHTLLYGVGAADGTCGRIERRTSKIHKPILAFGWNENDKLGWFGITGKKRLKCQKNELQWGFSGYPNILEIREAIRSQYRAENFMEEKLDGVNGYKISMIAHGRVNGQQWTAGGKASTAEVFIDKKNLIVNKFSIFDRNNIPLLELKLVEFKADVELNQDMFRANVQIEKKKEQRKSEKGTLGENEKPNRSVELKTKK